MPSLLSRFKRSPSVSSEQSNDTRRASLSSRNPSSDDETAITTPQTTSHFPLPGGSGSHFVEDFDDALSHTSPTKRDQPLSVPSSTSKVVGTPKLVLTEEGSNSPRSFSSSPQNKGSPAYRQPEPVGLGLGPRASSIYSLTRRGPADEIETPQTLPATMPVDTLSATNRDRSHSTASSHGGKSRRGSVASRVVNKVNGSPNLSPDSLAPPTAKHGKRRTRSISSTKSGSHGLGAALAKVASGGHGADSKRSPYLVRDGDSVDGEDDEEESDSDLDDHLPVTGFAVASNKRNADFHALFPAGDEGDYLIEDYGAALSKDILVQGRVYVSENYICFHANIFGWVTDVVIPFTDIRLIEKRMTALVIPNAILVSTGKEKYTFASFISRDTTYDVMMNIWRLCNPNAVMSTLSFANSSRPASIVGEDVQDKEEAPGKGHAPTQCACGKDGKHFSETALQTTLPSTPEKVYNLMFNSEWYKTFLDENQKLKDIEYSDWKPISADNKNLTRSTSYIKPLNGSIGPKQTKCYITDEHEHFDLEGYISMMTTTKTPDVPSGGVFSVKTRTCLTWGGANSTKVVVTTTVEWTGKSWVKGIIEKSAIEGQKQYHEDLESGMRAYIKEHATEFGAKEGETEAAVEEKPSEAEAYAAQTRQKRHEEDYSAMQGALDSVTSGGRAILSGVRMLVDSVVDVASDGLFGKQAVMAALILLLVISNIYTYYAFGSSTERKARRGEYDAVRVLLEGAALGQPRLTAREEGADLLRILDQVEARAERLRGVVKPAVQDS